MKSLSSKDRRFLHFVPVNLSQTCLLVPPVALPSLNHSLTMISTAQAGLSSNHSMTASLSAAFGRSPYTVHLFSTLLASKARLLGLDLELLS